MTAKLTEGDISYDFSCTKASRRLNSSDLPASTLSCFRLFLRLELLAFSFAKDAILCRKKEYCTLS